MFCRVCFDGHIEVLLAGGDEPETLTCPTCGCMVSSIKPVKPANLPINDPFNDDDASSGGGSGNARGSQERRIHDSTLGRDALGTEPYTAETWLTRSDIDEDFPLTPSAKTAALKAVLLKGFKDAPLDKVSFGSFVYFLVANTSEGGYLRPISHFGPNCRSNLQEGRMGFPLSD